MSLYRHRVWDWVVEIDEFNVIIRFVSEPDLTKPSYWAVIRPYWAYMRDASRPLSEDDMEHFIKLD